MYWFSRTNEGTHKFSLDLVALTLGESRDGEICSTRSNFIERIAPGDLDIDKELQAPARQFEHTWYLLLAVIAHRSGERSS